MNVTGDGFTYSQQTYIIRSFGGRENNVLDAKNQFLEGCELSA